jgi:RNA exonuclease 4
MDCEMVGVGASQTSALARVCLIDYAGKVLYDKFCKPIDRVTDHRTHVSGVRAKDLVRAPCFKVVQNEVAALIREKVVIGHALHNDFAVLGFSHPKSLIRDTSKYAPLVRASKSLGKRTPSLRDLALTELDLVIQTAAHSPEEDARAALLIYKKFRREWEQFIRSGRSVRNNLKRKQAPT